MKCKIKALHWFQYHNFGLLYYSIRFPWKNPHYYFWYCNTNISTNSGQQDIQSYFALKNLNLTCPPSTITGFCCIKWNKSSQKPWGLFAVSSITYHAVGIQTAKRMKGTEVINRNLNTGMNRFKPLKSSVAQEDLICATWGTCIWNT